MDNQRNKKIAKATKPGEDFDLSIINGASAVAYDSPEPIRTNRIRPGSSSGYGDNDDPPTSPPFSPSPNVTPPGSPDPLATPPFSPGPTRPYSPDPLATPPFTPGQARSYSPDPHATPPYTPGPTTRPDSPDPLATPPFSPEPSTRPDSPDPLATPPYTPGPSTCPYSPDPLATPPISPRPTRPYSPDPLATPPDSPEPTSPHSPDPLATPPNSPTPAANAHVPTPPGTPSQPPTPRNSTGGNEHVVIEIEEQPSIQTEADETESPFYSFFKIVNFACLAPYRFSNQYESKTFLSMWPYRVLHILLVLLHLLYFKHHIMFGAYITGKSNIALYIEFAHSLLQPVFVFAVAFTVHRRFCSFKKTIEKFGSTDRFKQFNKSKIRAMIAGMTTLGCMLAVLSVIVPIPESDIENMSNFEWIPTYYSRDVVYSLTAESYTDYLKKLFAHGQDLSRAFTIPFGTLICVLKIINLCLEQTGRQLILLSACTLKHCSEAFHSLIPTNTNTNIAVASGDSIVAAYSNLKRISRCLNESISGIYPLFLVENLLTMATFYNISFNPEVSIWGKLLAFMKVLQFRDWILDEGESILSQEQATHLRDDIQTNSIGIGRDSLFITGDFIISFFGISTAYFLSVVETRVT